jgi:hypothetical protein
MSSLPLTRTEYWNVSQNPPIPRTGSTAHGESITDIENYLLPLSQMKASGFYTWGVVDGLTVSAVAGQPGLTIAPGLALDLAGHVLALASGGSAVVDPTTDPTQIQSITTVPVGASGVALSTASNSGDCVLTLTFLEALGQSTLANAPTLVHAPWLRLIPVANFQDAGEQVILALVTLDANGNVTAVSTGPNFPDGTAAPGRQIPATHAGGITLWSTSPSVSATGLTVSDVTAGQLLADGATTVRLAASDPAGVLELAAGELGVTAGRLSLRAAGDTQGTQGFVLDATDSTFTAGTVLLGGAQSGVSLASGPAAGELGVTAGRLSLRAVGDSTGMDRISLDGTTSTVSTNSVLVGGAVSIASGTGGVLALSAPASPTQLGVGTPTPRNAVGIRGVTGFEELISFENAAGVTKWHLNQNFGPSPSGLNFAETGMADGRLYLQAGGHVGIGTTTPAFTLDVHGTACAQQFCNPSDLRAKRDVSPLANVLDRLADIRAVSYRPVKAGTAGRCTAQIGIIAQDAQGAFPELVVEMGPGGLKAVDYAGLAGVLVGAVQELQASNAALAARLDELEQLMMSPPVGRPAGEEPPS